MNPDQQPEPNQPASPTPSALANEVTTEPAPDAAAQADTALISWQASEYIHHDKRFGWYLGFFAIIAVLIAVAAITHQWLTIGVFVVMAGALMVYARKQPRVLSYSLGERGLTIDQKFYDYSSFKSFSVIQDVAWHLIDLDPMKRFMPRLSIMVEDDRRDEIVNLLAQHLPRLDRRPDVVERAARFLRF